MRFLVAEKLGPHKFKTPEGYLICTDAILSRTGKQEYKRCELFGDSCENPDKIVNVERTDDEVFSDKAMASFENKPICVEHPDHDVNAENHNELAVGFVRDIHKGEDSGKPVMMGTLVITDKDAVEAVENGEYKELSCGYDCDIDDNDEPRQRNIRGNHVALCKQGRAGIARIVDSVNDAWFGSSYPYEVWLSYPVNRRKFMAAAFKTRQEALQNTERLRQEWKNAKEGVPNAQIVERGVSDSVRDVNGLTKFKMALRNISKMYSSDPGIEYVTSTLKNLGYEVVIDSIDGWKENKNVPGEHIKQYRMSVMLEGREHHFLVQLYANMGEWKVKEINAYMLDSNSTKQGDSMKDTKLQDKYVLYKQSGIWYGTKQENYEARIQNANAIQSFKAFNSVDDIISYLSKYGHISKEDIIVKDSIKDEDFSKKTKQGFTVLEMYRDGGRLHVIFKRANDYGVALGYDTTDGQWAQGMYDYSTLNEAREALKETKPYAKRIQDSVNDDTWSSVEEENYEKANKALMKDKQIVRSSSGEIHVLKARGKYEVDAYNRNNLDYNALRQIENKFNVNLRRGNYGYITIISANKDAIYKAFAAINPAYSVGSWRIEDSATQDSKEQLFTVEYEQDGVMYVRKVRASSIEDAISKVKDDGHKVVVFTNQVLNELGKNNSIGKYDKVVQAMRSLYSESLLPDNELKELIRKKVPEYIKKYVKE